MTSRLDRLFILLESGSSAITRRAAAKQIGEVQKLYPHELHNLLNRLAIYMHSHSWDTRVAASQAIQAILENVPQWEFPQNAVVKTEIEDNDTPTKKCDAQFSFEKFNLQMILENGAKLMSSEGKEFDILAENENITSLERLTIQRAILDEKLGFTTVKNLGVNFNEMVTQEDMEPSASTPVIKSENVDVQDIINHQASSSSQRISKSGMSSREKNRAKRKARKIQTAGTSVIRSNSIKEEPETKKIKSEPCGGADLSNSVQITEVTWNDTINWPLEAFCNKLYADLFSARWETRHGAAAALREVMKTHINGGGRSASMSIDQQKNAHNMWLEDAAIRMLCVLALDRFGDYITDQVIAPVRETCAQVLGTIMKEMSNDLIQKTVEVLQNFIEQRDWEVRHAGIMGLKYFLVVREDLVPIYLPLIIKDILKGLLDSVDDVSSVSASALIPIASHLPRLLSREQVSAIVKMLWNLLSDQDELAAGASNFMGLLAAVLSLPNDTNWIEMEQIEVLIPILWPFLSHQSSSVRRSTLQTLLKLTEKTDMSSVGVKSDAPLHSNFGVHSWSLNLLQEALRHIFQRVLVEHLEDIQSLVVEVWSNIVKNSSLDVLLPAVCPLVSCWMCLAMQPARLAFESTSLIGFSKASRLVGDTSAIPNQKLFLGGAESIVQEIREKNVFRARFRACKMLGLLSKFLVLPAPNVVYKNAAESPIDCYAKLLFGYLSSRSSLQRIVSSMIITFWAENDPNVVVPPLLEERLRSCLAEYIYFDEISTMVTRLLQEASDFIASLKQYQVHLPQFDGAQMLTLDQIKDLSTTATENLKARFQLKTKVANLLEDRRKSLFNSYSQTYHEQSQLIVSTQSSLACAVSRLRCLPEKLNPVVKPLMESIKREENETMQKLAAESLAYLLSQTGVREPSPNSKIITNLSTLLRSDEDFTPPLGSLNLELKNFKPNDNDAENPYYGIITLQKQTSTRTVRIGCSSAAPGSSRGPGRPTLDMAIEDGNEVVDPARKTTKNQRIGSTFAVQSCCDFFGQTLPEALPALWELMFKFEVLIETEMIFLEPVNVEESTSLITSLQLLEVAAPFLHKNLHNKLLAALSKLCLLVQHPLKAIRHLAARCLATLTSINLKQVMYFVIDELIPLLSQIDSAIKREGSIEAITWVVNKLQFKVVPFVILLILPILKTMSDRNESVRLMSSNCFATLIQLMPLDGITSDIDQDLPEDLQERKLKDKEFLNYLFCPKSIPDFKIPVTINAELRRYQQAGINWLWFLNKFSLCGILCDDMGLGKTLQTICILAGDHHQRAVEKQAQLPSLVVCPPTLTGHWVFEVRKFVSEKNLTPLHYYGLPAERERLRNQIDLHNLVIASYDIVRKDIDFFQTIHWNYCVLDEGHIIKNGKTKCSKAMKAVGQHANHRLILSGTPIQNNVLELHSLFDFLMPGFLGSEKQFQVRFSRPILASRDPKSSPKEQEAGVLAMESLHRQVLPFLLRRVKEDVLTDLPAKITQDLICELSPLQERLYDDFSNTQSNLRERLESMSKTDLATKNKTHVFQALRYLQNVCNHPKLVLKPHHPEYQNILLEMQKNHTSLDDIEHSAKLPALKQLLLDCGIGTNEETSVNQHRALVFCQLKAMLDIIENDLLKKHLPRVSFLRLDGCVPANMRHEIVRRFNDDPSQDILLLTTQVGGLGLNLCGADTVIFVESDWNPMKDLQAMDRAHRIGQKRVVNVYRLITRNTLEEKIMGLQKFKLLTANTVVQNNNKDMETMGTEQILDLFNLTKQDGDGKKKPNDSGTSMKSMLENLPELWDDQQYAEEFDITHFIEGLKK